MEPVDHEARARIATARFGFWTSLATGVTTLVTFAIAIGTPPLSGPLCREGCFAYPFLDVASRFPRDYYWMFPALVANLLLVAWALALNARAAPDRRLVAQCGVAFAVMASLVIVGDYFVQLAVLQPSLLAGETDGLSLLSQYNAHGLFIALEELGYLLTSLSLACLASAFTRATRLERVIRRLFVGGFVVTVLTLCWFLFAYGHRREYLFEISVISIVWLVLIAGAFCSAVVFRRDARGA